MPPSTLKESIARQRANLAKLIAAPLGDIAERCSLVWDDRHRLNEALSHSIKEMPYCSFLYVLNTNGIQISDNVSLSGLHPEHFQRNRASRPYIKNIVPSVDFWISEAYLSLRARRPSVTTIQLIRADNRVVGYLGADFDLRDLPLTRELYEEPGYWRQIKGDPAIRGSVFTQTRADSLLDQRIDEVLTILEELITDHGVFHGKIHFSSNRATIWVLDDPYRFRLLDIDALIDPDVCLAYPRIPYPKDAEIPARKIRPILESFKLLRYADETIYLRSGSVNIFNGIVGLNFSCDGSHYMPYAQFLDPNNAFWAQQGNS